MELLVYIIAGKKLYFGLGFDFISFFEWNISTIQFLVFLINLQSYQWPKFFIKISIKDIFCENVIIKSYDQLIRLIIMKHM